MQECCAGALQWLDAQLQKQAAKRKCEDPCLPASAVLKKLKEVEDLVSPILNKPKPVKVEKESDKVEKKEGEDKKKEGDKAEKKEGDKAEKPAEKVEKAEADAAKMEVETQ